MDLDEVAERVRAAGAQLQRQGWIQDCEAPAAVADYIAASEYIDRLSGAEIVDIVRQGLALDTMMAAWEKHHKDLLRFLAREVILTKVDR